MLTHGTNPQQVALTFDDGPGEWTLPIVKLLHQHSARATFFQLGRKLRAMGQLMSGSRNEIGNHSFDHLYLGDHSEDVIREQITKCQEAIGAPPCLFRPPYGRVAPTPVDAIAESMGYKVVMWSCCPGDWAAKNTRDTVMHVAEQLNAATRGEIVLLHDGSPDGLGDRRYTVEAVDIILRMFPDREFVTVSQLDGLQ
jgi:peptidoglycan/xylan/chitin deacetylase (PgdA/CDA1 family)